MLVLTLVLISVSSSMEAESGMTGPSTQKEMMHSRSDGETV